MILNFQIKGHFVLTNLILVYILWHCNICFCYFSFVALIEAFFVNWHLSIFVNVPCIEIKSIHYIYIYYCFAFYILMFYTFHLGLFLLSSNLIKLLIHCCLILYCYCWEIWCQTDLFPLWMTWSFCLEAQRIFFFLKILLGKKELLLIYVLKLTILGRSC